MVDKSLVMKIMLIPREAVCFELRVEKGTVTPLYTNLQVVNFQRCDCASGSSKEPEPEPSTSGVSDITACPPSPGAVDLLSPTSSPCSGQ